MRKIKKRAQLCRIVKKLKKEGKRIGLANGVFDIIHSGHIRFLKEAKGRCDILIVSINTDSSARACKGSLRPIVNEGDRAETLACLECVDYVTFHPERKMAHTLQLVKPDLYLKGGDYSLDELTSKKIVERYGGRAEVLKMHGGLSTTVIIERILKHYCKKGNTEELPTQAHPANPVRKKPSDGARVCRAVFLDRDGVINEEIEYLHEPEKFRFIPGVFKGLKMLQGMGYKLVVVTTQAGIGLGYFPKEDFFRVNRVMLKALGKKGIIIDRIYFCPHSKADRCKCRKPEIGLLKRAKEELNINLKESFFIGDRSSDIRAGKRAHCKTILVRTGYCEENLHKPAPDYIAGNMIDAAGYIKKSG